jgi:hypothetical protein
VDLDLLQSHGVVLLSISSAECVRQPKLAARRDLKKDVPLPGALHLCACGQRQLNCVVAAGVSCFYALPDARRRAEIAAGAAPFTRSVILAVLLLQSQSAIDGQAPPRPGHRQFIRHFNQEACDFDLFQTDAH